MNLYALPIGERAPEIVNTIEEIPKGTCNKVEYDPELEIFRLDRVLHSGNEVKKMPEASFCWQVFIMKHFKVLVG